MRKTPEFEACLAELIAIPSVSSVDPEHNQSNRAMIDTLADYLEALGFDIEIMPVSEEPEKCNLIARLRPDDADGGLVLSGHTDTVPYDRRGWDTDPFTLTLKDDRYYGLGTADMKSYFPVIFEALDRLGEVDFKKPLTVIATADEESSMAGVRALKKAGRVNGDYCLIGEPTGMVPRHMHKGIIIETIYLEGKSGHSSDPSLGNSALEGMNDVMNALRDWRDELQAAFTNAEFKLPVPTLNLGRIHGGDSANRICAKCELSIDLRMLPGMPLEQIKQQLHARVNDAVAGSGLKVSFSYNFDGIPAMQTPAGSELVKMCEKLTGNRVNTVAFATEGPFFNDMGLETVILGPGDIEVAHQPNEYLPVARIEPMVDILSKLLIHFCGEQ